MTVKYEFCSMKQSHVLPSVLRVVWDQRLRGSEQSQSGSPRMAVVQEPPEQLLGQNRWG